MSTKKTKKLGGNYLFPRGACKMLKDDPLINLP